MGQEGQALWAPGARRGRGCGRQGKWLYRRGRAILDEPASGEVEGVGCRFAAPMAIQRDGAQPEGVLPGRNHGQRNGNSAWPLMKIF